MKQAIKTTVLERLKFTIIYFDSYLSECYIYRVFNLACNAP
jgi:hypothetical protein